MKSSRGILAAALAVAGFCLAAGDGAVAGNTVVKGTAAVGGLKMQLPGGGAVVNRHLKCFASPPSQIPTPIIPTNIPALVAITNNWQMTIPGGTVVTYRIAGKSATYQTASALGPGQKVAFGPTVPVPAAGDCDATIPG